MIIVNTKNRNTMHDQQSKKIDIIFKSIKQTYKNFLDMINENKKTFPKAPSTEYKRRTNYNNSNI